MNTMNLKLAFLFRPFSCVCPAPIEALQLTQTQQVDITVEQLKFKLTGFVGGKTFVNLHYYLAQNHIQAYPIREAVQYFMACR